ncbi:MAG TPA: DUF3016 domain-containing protein [Rhodanobacter sp.]|nr:DUF3016 domain-containing protein [Rhodanobacter sp.]
MKRSIGMSQRNIAFQIAIALCAGSPLFSLATAMPAAATATSPADARVSVTYVNPEKFSEATEFNQQDSYNGSRYLESLKAFLIKRAAKMLPAGDRLEVTITDIKLAGAYEPWHGPNFRYVRFMKDVYPPRIDLQFKLVGSDGQVLREGSRKLRNLGYLQSGLTRPNDTDPLRYDKGLLDSWLRRGPDKL